jgi:hypothetical protein
MIPVLSRWEVALILSRLLQPSVALPRAATSSLLFNFHYMVIHAALYDNHFGFLFGF